MRYKGTYEWGGEGCSANAPFNSNCVFHENRTFKLFSWRA